MVKQSFVKHVYTNTNTQLWAKLLQTKENWVIATNSIHWAATHMYTS